MKVRAQIAMVLNPDKCIGCHNCSVTCKQVWASRKGVEYAWFSNVKTKPGIGYPKEWENQDRWKGGWTRKRNGALRPAPCALRPAPAHRRQIPQLPGDSEGNLRRLRKDLHVLPAAPVRALLQPGLRRRQPVRLDLQAGGRRHRAGRPGQVPRLAACAAPPARTMRSTTTRKAARPRNAYSATRASRQASPLSARKPASAAFAISECCSTTPTASTAPPPCRTRRTSTRPAPMACRKPGSMPPA